MRNFLNALNCYVAAHRFVREHRLWPFVLIPGLLSLLYLSALFTLAVLYSSDLAAYTFTQWFPESWQGNILSVIGQILIWLVLLVAAYLTYQQIVLVLFSPLLGMLSEIVERKQTGREAPPFRLSSAVKDIWRGMRINSRYLIRSLLWSVPAWLALFIPLIGTLLSPMLLWLIQAFYGGAGLIDPNLERRKFTVRQSVAFVRQQRARVLGVGCGFLMLLMIPLAGWMLAPAYGTVAATLATLPILETVRDIPPKLQA